MKKTNKFVNMQRQSFRSLVATALLAGGIFQFVAPVLAEGTLAGQSISNTATATYKTPTIQEQQLTPLLTPLSSLWQR